MKVSLNEFWKQVKVMRKINKLITVPIEELQK